MLDSEEFDIDEFLASESAIATTFADPEDIENFHAAKARGMSDVEASAYGDNGQGAWGDDTTSEDDPMVALPRDLPGIAHNRRVKVIGPSGTVIARVADKMPRLANIKNGAGIDLNPAAARATGVTGKSPVQWRFADDEPETGQAFDIDAFIASDAVPEPTQPTFDIDAFIAGVPETAAALAEAPEVPIDASAQSSATANGEYKRPEPTFRFLPQSAAQADVKDAATAREAGPLIPIPKAEITADQSTLGKGARAAYNTVAGFVEGMTSVDGVAMMLNPIVGVAEMGMAVPELIHKVREAEKTPPNSPERWQAGTDVLGLLALPAAIHAVSRAKGRPKAEEPTAPKDAPDAPPRPDEAIPTERPPAGETAPATAERSPLGARDGEVAPTPVEADVARPVDTTVDAAAARPNASAGIESRAVDAPQFAYHVTTADRLSRIQQQGLTPDSKRLIGAPSLDAHSKGRVFLTSEEGVSFWRSRAEDHIFDKFDDFDQKVIAPVVLRIKKEGAFEADKPGTTDARAESFTTNQPITPDKIEVWDGAEWKPVAEGKIDPRSSFDDQGYFRDDAPLSNPKFASPEPTRTATEVAPLPDARAAEAQPQGSAAGRASEKVDIPEHLRRDPEIETLLADPASQTGPQLKAPVGAPEGGALGFGGGKRPTVAPKGTTPKGDTEFLRVEPGWKRIGKGLEFKGAADVLETTRNKVGQLLAKATRRHVDLEQELHGQLASTFERALKGIPKKEAARAFDELQPYLAAKENGRPLPAISPNATKLLKAWEGIADQTGKLAVANNVQVFDPVTGTHRPMGRIGGGYVPRMLKPEVQRVMQDPKTNPALWNTMVDEFAKSRGIATDAAAIELRAEAGRFASSDFMGNLERARTGKLPEMFYEYDLRQLAGQYIPSFTERMSQIIAYGQRLGPRERPLRENLWDIARKEAENVDTQTWLNAAEDQAVNLRSRTAAGKGMARAQTLASGLLLSSPTTSVMRNMTSGLVITGEVLGHTRSARALSSAAKKAHRENAREIGAVRENMGDFLHADKLGESFIDDAVRAVTDKALKWSGYNGSEVFVRSHAALTASQFAKDGVAAILKRPDSMRSKEALGLFKRMGADAEKIVAEGANWKTGPETRKFIRTVIRDVQGGYKMDQVPLWANSNIGRFLMQFARWGTQRSRNIWKNGIKPALGEEVEWHGKKMMRRDFRPLLKMAATTVVMGEAFAGIAQVLFGRDRKDASLQEIGAVWEDDKAQAFALAAERAINDLIMAGTLGIWSQPLDFVKNLKDQSRLKNPAEPPGLGSVKALVELGKAAYDQADGLTPRVTRADLEKFAAGTVPGAKQLVDVARNVYDEPLYEAQNDVKTLRAAAKRWAKRDAKLDVAPRSKGDFGKSPMAPEYEPIKEALLSGNAAHAKVLKDAFLAKQPDRAKAMKALKASIKQSQPFRVGPYTSAEHRADFRVWARRNLSKADFDQTERVQARYAKAAASAGLWD